MARIWRSCGRSSSTSERDRCPARSAARKASSSFNSKAPSARSERFANGATDRSGWEPACSGLRPAPPASTSDPQGWTRCARAASIPARMALPTSPRPTMTSPTMTAPFPMHASSSRASASFRPEGLTSLQRTCHCQAGAAKVRKRALFRRRGTQMSESTEAKQEPRRKTKAPQPKGKAQACKIEGCKRAYQAKGYCFFHYDKWKAGELPKARYKTCSKEGCLKKVVAHGLCAEHQPKKEGAAGAAPAGGAPAPTTPPPAA